MSVLCIGQIVADVVVRPVDSLPPAGRLLNVEDLRLVSGGCAANTASVLAKLGAGVALIGLVGEDSFADAVFAELAGVGIDTSGIIRDPCVRTSAVIVVVDRSGERSFLYREGGNEQLTDNMVHDSILGGARYVHIGGVMKLVKLDLPRLLERARSHGCVTALDTDWDATGRWLAALEHALPYVDFLMTNEDEGKMLTGFENPNEIGKKLLDFGPRAVIVKRGPLGSTLITQAGAQTIPPFDVKVMDTTCAGDSFAGGFLFGLVNGFDLETAARFGNATGALCTTQISHTGIISFEKTMEFISAQSVFLCPTQKS